MSRRRRRALLAATAGILAAAACGPQGERQSSPSPVEHRADSDAAMAIVARAKSLGVMKDAIALGFIQDGNWLWPQLSDGAWKGVIHKATVQLPARASQGFDLRDDDSGVAIRVKLEGASDAGAESEAEPAGGHVVFRGAGPSGSHWIHRVGPEGNEDYLLFDNPAPPAIRYEVALNDKVAGLRLVENVLEFLDAGGAPRLRMAHPFAVDGKGAKTPLRISVSGCAYDSDPRGPWGRAVRPAGAQRCAIVLPSLPAGTVLLDPSWTATGNLGQLRTSHTATLLGSGKVLVAGGSLSSQTAELYDPGTGTWSATGSMANTRYYHTATLLAGGKVLVAGGGGGGGSTAELYDPTTGNWSATGSMAIGRELHTATLLAGGKVLVAGNNGPDLSAELYDPATGMWSATGSMANPRAGHTATLLAGGKVLVAGGYNASAELYDPATGMWSATGSMANARSGHTATLLAGGKVLVAGGNDGNSAIPSAELYDPATGNWSATGSMANSRELHTATLLAGGKVLVAGGGGGGNNYQSSAELYDPASGMWSATGTMANARTEHTATLLGTGAVLAAGGEPASTSAELFGLIQGNGTCLVDGECFSTHCADGVCCDKPCQGVCEACSAAVKGYGKDGVCEPVMAGLAGRAKCKDDGSPSCMNDGLCDGMGACQKYSVQQGCTPEPCTDSTRCTTGFCVKVTDKDPTGICCDTACANDCEVCTAAAKGSGADGICGPAKPDTNPRGKCVKSPGFPQDCKADGLCGGGLKCREVALKGTLCANDAKCTDDTKLFASTCNDTGTCAAGTTPCSPYRCANSACGTSCKSSDDCISGDRCNAGACEPKLDDGTACQAALDCKSSNCVDTVCCKSASCAPYRCAQFGICAVVCQSSADCADGFMCDSAGHCVEKKLAETTASCALSLNGDDRGMGIAVAGAMFVLALGSRRRRERY